MVETGVSRSVLSSSARISPRSATVSRTRRPRANEVSSAASSGGRSRAVDTGPLPGKIAPEAAAADRLDERLDIGHASARLQIRHVATDQRERPGGQSALAEPAELDGLGGDGELDRRNRAA